MANYERGSTEHDHDVPVFDGGDDDGDAEGSHLPVVIVITILVLAAFGGVVWLAYNQGVARGRSDVPARVAMEPGSAQPSNQIKIYQQPAPAETDQAYTATPQRPQPVPAAAKPVVQHMAQAEQAAKPAPLPKPVKPQAVPHVSTVATAPPAQLSAGLSKPVAKPVEKAAAAPPAPKMPATVAMTTPAPGSYVLQIGAYKSQEEAMIAWRAFQSKHHALLTGFGPDVQKADLGSKGVWYRLRVGSFADKNAATALCDRLKAENGACFLAR